MAGFEFDVVDIAGMPQARLNAARLIDKYLSQAYGTPERDYFTRVGSHVILAAVQDDRVIGASHAFFESAPDIGSANCLRIAHLVTDEPFERCGVATALLTRLERVATLTGMTTLKLSDSSDIDGFYERRGYEKHPFTGWHFKTVPQE